MKEYVKPTLDSFELRAEEILGTPSSNCSWIDPKNKVAGCSKGPGQGKPF